jgi:hypothetical protein
MTSRSSRWHEHTEDEVGVLLRCALRERVAGAAPSSTVWKGIQEAARGTGNVRQAWIWLRLQLAAVRVVFSGVNGAFPVRELRPTAWGNQPLAKYDLNRMWLDQHQVLHLVC